MKVVVIGAGAGGLAAALTLSRSGHDVTVLERDATPVPEHFEESFAWARRGAPQFHHSHIFLPRLRKILKDRYPDVLEGLVSNGVEELSMAPMLGLDTGDPGTEELVALPCRRTTYEWVLRSVVQGSVQIRAEAVVGLTAVADRVTGVRLDSGEVLDADLVVACTGRRGDVVGWLSAVGVHVEEEVKESPATYATRFYRLRDGAEPLPSGYRLGRRDSLGYGIFPADNRTHSVSLFVRPQDEHLRRRILDEDRFDATCAQLAETAPYVDPCAVEAITPVNPMSGLINRLRTFAGADGMPLVTGFVALGDAYMVTNPTYGRGCSLAAIQAVHLADALVEHPDDLSAAVQTYERSAADEIRPWYYLSVLADGVAAAADQGGDFTLGSGPVRRAPDVELQLAFARIFSVLDPPTNLYTNPRLAKLMMTPLSQQEEDVTAA